MLSVTQATSLTARTPLEAKKARRISLAARLRSYGFAGVAAYGLLNTVYYVTAFLFFWTHVAKVPKGSKVIAAHVMTSSQHCSSL